MMHSLQAIGDTSMAYRCFKLAVTCNNDHAEAYNNIGVLEWRRGRGEQVSCIGWVGGQISSMGGVRGKQVSCMGEQVGYGGGSRRNRSVV